MKATVGLIVGALLVVGVGVAASELGSVHYDSAGGGNTFSTLTVTGAASFDDDIKMTGGDDIVNSVALTGDSASNTAAMLKLGTDASPFATTAARKIGGATVIAGGIGTANATLTVGNCALAAIVIAGTGQAGTAWTQTFTEGTDWARGGTDTSAALALANAIDVGATTSLYVTASNVAGVVGIEPIPGKVSSITFTGDGAGTCAAEVNGADGSVWLNDGSSIAPALAFASSPTYGFYRYTSNTMGIAGALRTGAAITSDTYVAATSYLQAATDLNLGDDINPTVSAAATDVAVPITTLTSEEPYAATPPTVTPTNTTGGNIVIAPANGARRLADSGDNDGMCGGAECTAATGTTVITWPTNTDGVVTNCAITEGAATAAGVFHCNGHTEADCATSVCASMTVAPCTLLTCTAANNVVSVKRVAGSVSYIGPGVVTAGGGSNIVAENGTDGVTRITSGYTYIGSPSQGVRLDTTTNNILTLTDESGGSIGLTVNGDARVLSNNSLYFGSDQYWSRDDTSGTEFEFNSTNVDGGGTNGNVWLVDDGTDDMRFVGHQQSVPQTVNCDADCDSPVVLTAGVVLVNCTNAAGCAMTLSESLQSATAAGSVVLIAGPTQTGVLTLADEANVTELAGGVSWTPAERDTLSLTYSPTLYWVETSRADNTP